MKSRFGRANYFFSALTLLPAGFALLAHLLSLSRPLLSPQSIYNVVLSYYFISTIILIVFLYFEFLLIYGRYLRRMRSIRSYSRKRIAHITAPFTLVITLFALMSYTDETVREFIETGRIRGVLGIQCGFSAIFGLLTLLLVWGVSAKRGSSHHFSGIRRNS